VKPKKEDAMGDSLFDSTNEEGSSPFDAVIPPSWRAALAGELREPYFAKLMAFVAEERKKGTVYPAEQDTFAALQMTDYERVSVVILGQDPYHGPGQAHGLAFSVKPGVATPPSLRNIFKELEADAGCSAPAHGCLAGWARQGVLLLNTTLTVRQGEANSHQKSGWPRFTDAIIRAVRARREQAVFVLWGAPAQKKESLIDTTRHVVIKSPHPSPLSAHQGFFGSRPFTKANAALREFGKREIEWRLEGEEE